MTEFRDIDYLSLPRVDRYGADSSAYLRYADALREAGYPKDDIDHALEMAALEKEGEDFRKSNP